MLPRIKFTVFKSASQNASRTAEDLTKPNTVKNNQFFITLYNAGGKKESSGCNQLFPLDKLGETGYEKKARKRTEQLMKISM